MPDDKITFDNGSEIAVCDGVGKIRGAWIGTGTPAEKAVINHPPYVEKSLWGKDAEDNLAKHLRAQGKCPHGVGLEHDCAECLSPKP